MSVTANNGLNAILFQQKLQSLITEQKSKTIQEEAKKQVIDDFADLSASAKTKVYQDNLSESNLNNSIENETSDIAAQKAILTEGQNILELQAIPDNLNSVKNHITNYRNKAIFQVAHQPKENILALIS